MRGGTALAQCDLQHWETGILNGINQALSKAQKFCLFRLISHINATGVLKPQHRNMVPGTECHKLIHLNQSLTVEFSAHAEGLLAVLRIIQQKALHICHKAYQQSVYLGKTGHHLGAITALVFHKDGIIYQTGNEFPHLICAAGIGGEQGVQILQRVSGLLRRINPEKFRIIGRQISHIFPDGIQ